MTDRVDLEAIKARAASAARSGLADPANPNYFLTGSIVAMRGGLSDLRDYIMEPGDFDASELGEIATRLIKLAWPTSQPGFSAADERERSAWAAWPDDVDAMAAELASLRAQRDALVAQSADGIQECDNCGEERLTAWLDESGDVECIQCSAKARDELWHRWDELRAQRDAALAALDAAVAEQDRAATEATAQDADSPAAASARGRAGGVYLAAELVRAALGVQPEPDDG